MAIGINSLLKSSIDYSRWKVDIDRRLEESNQRFNILLEESRAINRRAAILEN